MLSIVLYLLHQWFNSSPSNYMYYAYNLFSFCEKDWLWPSKGESLVQFIWWSSKVPTSELDSLASSLIIPAGSWNYFFYQLQFRQMLRRFRRTSRTIINVDLLDWWSWWCSDSTTTPRSSMPVRGPHRWCSIRLNTWIFIQRRYYCNFWRRKQAATSIADIITCLQFSSLRLCMLINPQMWAWW